MEIHLTRTPLDCGKKPEHPEETHADRGRACRLLTVRDSKKKHRLKKLGSYEKLR